MSARLRRFPLADRGHAVGLGLCFLFLVWANIVTPLWADDYCRTAPFSLTSPVLLAWRDYFQWTGRFFATALTYFALATLPPWWMIGFDILNALVFVGLIDTVLRLGWIAGGNPVKASRGFLAGVTDMVVVGLLVWWLPRTIGEVALWKTGAIGYLWPVAGELWLLRRMLEGRATGRFWIGPFAFFIANFLEPLSLAMSGVFALYGVRQRRQGRPVPLALIVGQVLGTMVLLGAPGNFARTHVVASSSAMDRVAGIVSNLGSLFDPCWIVALVLIVLCFVGRPAGGRVLAAGRGWVFLPLALVYMATLLGVPRAALAARVSFPASMFLVCYVAALFLLRPVGPVRDRLVGVMAVMLVGVHLAVCIADLTRVAAISRAWAADPQLARGAGSHAVLPLVKIGRKTLYVRKDIMFAGLTPNPAHFINACYARAKGVASVVAR
ncbi:DUF6056 family protein [Gluconacetobacter takamatsuzukensis]|uniref:Uncharacterized protein n=1 Tax=Gluconacetobacter takamatsuzukensis TaxID=1286190 RepID=A0A7W4KCS3_9PROT|nr:DUF6056 family protein [Gluconacetobacter takamatsuzukensis]MBB2204567.1 hypothetical protein [Gluconacetobacter takamatsuzukensis]